MSEAARTRHDGLLRVLAEVAGREEARAIAEFEASHGRSYDASSDGDFDVLDKSYVQVELAMNVIRNAGPAADSGPTPTVSP